MSNPYLKIISDEEENRCNCVLWCRYKVPNLPYGLISLKDKKKIINTKKAKKGNIAIIETAQYWGHVALVKKVGKNHITIQEANFQYCKITERHNTEKNLKIIGYFNPKK